MCSTELLLFFQTYQSHVQSKHDRMLPVALRWFRLPFSPVVHASARTNVQLMVIFKSLDKLMHTWLYDLLLLSKDTSMSVLYSSICNERTACLVCLHEDAATYCRPNSAWFGTVSQILQLIIFHSYCTSDSCNLKNFSSIAIMAVNPHFWLHAGYNIFTNSVYAKTRVDRVTSEMLLLTASVTFHASAGELWILLLGAML